MDDTATTSQDDPLAVALSRWGPGDDLLPGAVADLQELQREASRFRLRYKFAIDEVTTKISILRQEFEETHDHSPIEHVRSRLKSPASLMAKVAKLDVEPTFAAIEQQIRDIAGVRVVCPFVSDVYWIQEMLTGQSDVTVLEVEDYIADPKPNGYRSLHTIIKVPVYLSDRTEHVPVEVQIRTIAMDFWASVEHTIYYKYDGTVPAGLLDELGSAARTAADLDATMARLRGEVRKLP
ncbi:GTP pyrophosphokinase [Nocardioides insulae]|uniref:GTP pyrophosphokinase n=1 Tax=Nocardioides insulae TaxID=394734 RepID=UPI0003F89AA2|nr:GTP pyrophosphokinase family protein [Nocardioides insulae]